MKTKDQKCETCKQVFRFKELTELLPWCPRCFRNAIKSKIRYTPKRLEELKDE